MMFEEVAGLRTVQLLDRPLPSICVDGTEHLCAATTALGSLRKEETVPIAGRPRRPCTCVSLLVARGSTAASHRWWPPSPPAGPHRGVRARRCRPAQQRKCLERHYSHCAVHAAAVPRGLSRRWAGRRGHWRCESLNPLLALLLREGCCLCGGRWPMLRPLVPLQPYPLRQLRLHPVLSRTTFLLQHPLLPKTPHAPLDPSLDHAHAGEGWIG